MLHDDGLGGSQATAVASGGVRPSEFREIQSMAHDIFGLELKTGKEALVGARLGKRVRELGLKDISDYLGHVKQDHSGLELAGLIDALTTNFTSFLREPVHFKLLRDRILPGLAGRQTYQIWSAGCSTGEEPYSILFETAETLGDTKLGAMKLLATDISTRALKAASEGIFPVARLKELPDSWRKRYFQRGTGQQEGMVRVRPEWRARVQFERLNLMEDLSRMPRCAVIFCRNVMIYFDKPTQERLVGQFAARLDPGGWLLIGHSEGLMGVRHDLEYVMPAVYRKPGAGR
ncbi:MAG: protein-glutamate O-methyltransferase CheR [Bryobacterales bacterium]|nr:protein-glutamate O-methyltransferase CheR [Bryobacterales bacterium]